MYRFIAQRLFYILINVLIVSIVIFIASRLLPYDPVEELLNNGEHSVVTPLSYEKEYRRLSKQMSYDLPIFYFSAGRQSSPDTLHRIPRFQHDFVQMLIKENGDWSKVQSFLNDLKHLKTNPDLRSFAHEVYNSKSLNEISHLLTNYPNSSLNNSFDLINNDRSLINHFIPRIKWHGHENQFHAWASDILKGDFGLSAIDGRSASKKIIEAIQWTLLLNLMAILLIFWIGIWMGVWSGFTSKIKIKKITQHLTYTFYAIPIFWLATILIVFFTTDDYGTWTNWFASVGLLNHCSGSGIISCFLSNFKYMVLPLVCLILPNLAYLSRQMESSINSQSKKRYTLFLKSQGYSRKTIYFKYILKNALLPIVTIFGSALPALLSGSLIIEILFNIPGIGRLLYESIFANDWNIVFQMVIISSILIMVGYLIVDLLYKWVNPRIKLQS